MKKHILLVMLAFVAAGINAQNVFEGNQEFHNFRPEQPYMGFDMLRQQNPEIIIQVHPPSRADLWVNDYKVTTYQSPMNGRYYDETGYYKYDTVTRQWKEDMVSRYNIQFAGILLSVAEVTAQKIYADTAGNWVYKKRFVLNISGKPDSVYEDHMRHGITTQYATGTNTYDFNGILVKTHNSYGGLELSNYFEYNAEGRMTNEYYISGGMVAEDSSSKYSYAYDSEGRLKEVRTEVRDVSGSPFVWTTTRRVVFTYNSDALMTTSFIYTYDHLDNYKEVLYRTYQYAYNANKQITEITEGLFSHGIKNGGERIAIFYDGEYASSGFGYEWDGSDYSTSAAYRYFFSQLPTGTDDVAKTETKLTVYPNPASDRLFINEAPVNTQIRIFDVTGKLVMEVAEHKSGIDISSLKPGIYQLLAGTAPVKFIKQ